MPVNDSLSVIKQSKADVMFENSPVNVTTGQPAIDHVRAALNANMHAITANKGTVVYGYRELTALAKSKNKKFYFELTVLGGTPVFSVFREAMAAAELMSFKGIINSTTNIILTRMENGETFDEAVKYCQSIGVAETYPSNDVDGWDAAIKVVALITLLMDTPFTPQEVNRTGIRGITPEMIRSAKEKGQRWKLVASAERSGNSNYWRVSRRNWWMHLRVCMEWKAPAPGLNSAPMCWATWRSSRPNGQVWAPDPKKPLTVFSQISSMQ